MLKRQGRVKRVWVLTLSRVARYPVAGAGPANLPSNRLLVIQASCQLNAGQRKGQIREMFGKEATYPLQV